MSDGKSETEHGASEHDKRVAALAGELHEEWREGRLDPETGEYAERVKTTTDQGWIDSHGTPEVDIANTSYEDLPEDWKGENKISAEVSVSLVERALRSGVIDIESDEFLEEASATVHEKWLERNGSWAPAEQNLPYSELSEEEKDKDRVMVKAAIRIVTAKPE